MECSKVAELNRQVKNQELVRESLIQLEIEKA